MAKIYAKLNFVLKIDKKLNVLHYRNEFDTNDTGPTSADLKSTRQFRAESFAPINTSTSNRLLACAVGPDAQIWNWDTKKCVGTCKGKGTNMLHLVKIDEDRFASGCRDGTIQIWSSRIFFYSTRSLRCFRSAGKLSRLKKLPNNQLGCYQEQNPLLLTSYFNIKIWNIDSGELVVTLSEDFYWIFKHSTILSNQNLLQPDKRYIKVWEISRGGCKLLKTITAHSSNIDELVALNSEHVMSRSNGEPIKIWNNINWQCMKTLPGMVDWFKSLQLLTCIGRPVIPDPDFIEKVVNPCIMNVWDTTNKGNIIKKIDTSDRLVRGSYLNQIKAFVTYSDFWSKVNRVHVWDLRRLNCMKTIEVGKGYFYCAIFI